MGHSDPIETVTFKHEEGNEGEKIGVKRRIGAFYGGKLLKRQGRWTDSALRSFRADPAPCDLTARQKIAVKAEDVCGVSSGCIASHPSANLVAIVK
jgi:hypothetical protein